MNFYDDEILEFAEWQIKSIDDDDFYETNNKIKCSIISFDEFSDIPVYENDMNLLKLILDCDSEKEIIGRRIIAVCKDDFIMAIGNQGLYIPLYYRDNSSIILSEDELCELLGRYKVVRYNINHKVITCYEVPRKNTIKYGSYQRIKK